LPSWIDGDVTSAITDFVRSVTEPGDSFVPVADRIATFDNDGTLWVEQPAPPQFDFLLRTWAKEAQEDPSLASQGGGADAFVKDPAEEISQSTLDWVEGFVPAQIGAGNYIAHITVGFATLEDLKGIEAEPFGAFDIRPIGVAVYHLGNSGTARTELKAWSLGT